MVLEVDISEETYFNQWLLKDSQNLLRVDGFFIFEEMYFPNLFEL